VTEIIARANKFKTRVDEALGDDELQRALSVIRGGFVKKRLHARTACRDFENLSNKAVQIKDQTLANLDYYLEIFEQNVNKSGGHIHYASTPEDARSIIKTLCRNEAAKKIVKSKTMVGEEIGLTPFLENEGIETIETDLGEYIIQLRGEMPSHIIAPALHLTRGKIRKDFKDAHTNLDENRLLEEPKDFVSEARAIMRQNFVTADIGITGANFLVAETGSTIIVTNEGNGDLCEVMPKTHIVLSSIEKIVPGLSEAAILLRLLARSATGQPITAYTTFSTGPARSGDPDGPENFHVVLLDNGRSEMVGGEFHEMMRCIRCGACLNHCPVYQAVGGHAYGSVYPGPMGAVLSPKFQGQKEAHDLPRASSFCGRCVEVCPMQIPLTKMMRKWREKSIDNEAVHSKLLMRTWAFLAKDPVKYNLMLNLTLPLLSRLAKISSIAKLLPAANAWIKHRDLPEIHAVTFQKQWRRQQNG